MVGTDMYYLVYQLTQSENGLNFSRPNLMDGFEENDILLGMSN